MDRPASATDASPNLTSVQRETLRVVLDMLVPASAQPRRLAAGELPQVLRAIENVATELPEVRSGLDMLQQEATARHGAAFATLDPAQRATLLGEFAARHPAALQRLAAETVTCYYQQDDVIKGLGLEARPPYPVGYQVVAGDLTLLTPVKARGKIWRDAS
jgi:hypothetical protein